MGEAAVAGPCWEVPVGRWRRVRPGLHGLQTWGPHGLGETAGLPGHRPCSPPHLLVFRATRRYQVPLWQQVRPLGTNAAGSPPPWLEGGRHRRHPPPMSSAVSEAWQRGARLRGSGSSCAQAPAGFHGRPHSPCCAWVSAGALAPARALSSAEGSGARPAGALA